MLDHQLNGTSNRQDYVVGTSQGSYDGSTTVFPATYDSGFVDVYLNGIKLQPADFTATNGTSVTLGSAAQTSDTVSIVGYGTFELSNFSIGDANNVDLTGLADDQFLQYNSTSGNFEPATVATDLSGDSSPQLGGVLDTNGNNIEFPDSSGTEVNRLKFGAGDDLQIYHDGGASRIVDSGTGPLSLQGHQVKVLNAAAGETMATFTQNGSVDFYYDNSKKIETTSTGIDVTGTAEMDTLSIGGTAVTATPAELNILDGVTATATELNILDGVTATTAELNLLDGVTATTAELNYTDGVTSNIQTQLNSKGIANTPIARGHKTSAQLSQEALGQN